MTIALPKKPRPLATDPLLDDAEMARYFQKDPRTIKRWRQLKLGPPFVRVPGIAGVRYRLSQVIRWLEKHEKN